jgi:hypothetical protein
MTSWRSLERLWWLIAVVLVLVAGEARGGGSPDRMSLQVVSNATGQVLWEHAVNVNDYFTIDYRHSSDHTPVHDIFRIAASGVIVLTEEDYLWYGAGLEFNAAVADISFSDSMTRVRLHRVFPEVPLRVGEVAHQVLTIHRERLPLLSIAKGRESVCIRVNHKTAALR